jgi:hypothetical protein
MKQCARACCVAIIVAFFVLVGSLTSAQEQPCEFDQRSFAFAGSALAQATCLLRLVLQGGRLAPQSQKLPAPLSQIVGAPMTIDRSLLRRYLSKHQILETDIGGSLDEPLSPGRLADGIVTPARYFVIHDVSTPNYLEKSFPANIDEADWEWNDLSKHWANNRVAHIFINRLGESVTAVPFNSSLPQKRFGTKFARDRLLEKGKGLQLHVELIQPRRSDPLGKTGNDAIAPLPGFTDAQMDRLALIYLAASVRRGEWLIPAFHAAMDAGIPDAHDDPQNFDLNRWAKRLDLLLRNLKKK